MNRRKFIQKVGLFGVIALIGKSFFKASEPNLDVLEYAQMQIDAAIKNDKEDNPDEWTLDTENNFDVQKFAINQAKRGTFDGKELIIYIDGKPVGRTKSMTMEIERNME